MVANSSAQVVGITADPVVAGSSAPIVEKSTKSFLDAVKNDGLDTNGNLEFIIPGSRVTFSEEEWEEGNKLWQHVVLGAFLSFKPSYSDVLRWVGVNWKSYKPKVSHLKPGIYLFEFSCKEDQRVVLSRNRYFYHKS